MRNDVYARKELLGRLVRADGNTLNSVAIECNAMLKMFIAIICTMVLFIFNDNLIGMVNNA